MLHIGAMRRTDLADIAVLFRQNLSELVKQSYVVYQDGLIINETITCS